MKAKLTEKAQALQLRENGYTYSEILNSVNVSRSTLSLWLRNIKIDRKFNNYIYGAKAKREQRIEKTNKINNINKKELFYMGIMLYWAEGAKARNGNISQCVDFSNSDYRMCKTFLKWLKICLNIKNERIRLYIYIHESQKFKTERVLNYWSKITKFPKSSFNKIYFTKTVYPRKKKRQATDNYYGQLRIKVRKSTDLNRKIAGWTTGIYLNLEP